MKFFFVVSCLLLGNLSQAYENLCHDRFEGPVQGICQGRMLPSAKTRNISVHQLECSSYADHYFRSQQEFDYRAWDNLLIQNQEIKAQQMRRTSQPDIRWSGTIPYSTIETWDWQSCELETNGFECGYDTKYRTVTVSKCTGTGQNYKCRDVEQEESYQVPRTCWYDVTHAESWPCSQETMTYNAEYARPDYNEWKPGAPNYIDAIPNKYDLLPGEIEDVQVFNTSSASTRLTPMVQIGGAWNKYDTTNVRGSGNGAQCRQNDNLHIDVTIKTLARDAGRKTPNAFKFPRRSNGSNDDVISWKGGPSKDNGSIDDAIPQALRLADSSAGVMNALAEQSQKVADREQEKQQSGQGKTADNVLNNQKGHAEIFKNTDVRVQLKKKNKHMWDSTFTREVLIGQDEGVVASTNILSSIQEIAFSDIWLLTLKPENGPGAYMAKHTSRERHLRPDQDYYFEVSMYQKGAKGLYLQSCKEDPTYWGCHFSLIGLGRHEDDYFSDPLQIPFHADPNIKDERGLYDKFLDFIR